MRYNPYVLILSLMVSLNKKIACKIVMEEAHICVQYYSNKIDRYCFSYGLE